MKLLGAPLSPFVRKVAIIAQEKGIEYDHDKRISPMSMPDDYTEIHPLRRIPALLPDPDNPAFAINDSSAICGYLEKLVPSPAFYPDDPVSYGRALWLEELADTGLGEQVGMGVFRPVMFNISAGKPADYEKADAGFERLARGLLAYLEKQLDGQEWFVGDAFSIADLAIASQLINLAHVGYDIPADAMPQLAAWKKRACARASLAATLEEDNAFFAKNGLTFPATTA